jgi:hypothetical protein
MVFHYGFPGPLTHSHVTLFLLLENPNTRRKPMEKITRTNGANFTVAEEPGKGNRSRRLCHHPAIVVGLAIEVCATAITGKE